MGPLLSKRAPPRMADEIRASEIEAMPLFTLYDYVVSPLHALAAVLGLNAALCRHLLPFLHRAYATLLSAPRPSSASSHPATTGADAAFGTWLPLACTAARAPATWRTHVRTTWIG